jgi:3-hydroxyacyl-[acyl-carrier-protein] dehydratase
MRWIWIDRFIEFEPGVKATAVKNISLAEEHLHDHWEAFPIMPASLMIEGTAQTAGILVGQMRDFCENVILAKITKATFDGVATPGDQLKYCVELDRIDENGASTSGTVLKNDEPFGEVNLMFSHVTPENSTLGLPAENFVFTGQFERLVAPFTEGANGQ